MALLLLVMVIGTGAARYLAPGLHRAAGTSRPGPQALSSVSVPLFFEPNQGQSDPQVRFLARGSGYGLFLTGDEAVLKLQPAAFSLPPSGSSVIRMKLEAANSSARVSGASPLPGRSSYFIGNNPSRWRHDIPQFARVEYQAVYPGVDLAYYGNQGQLEYDFRVAPDADPNQIALHFDGASVHIESGDLILATGQGDVRFHAPRIYQQDGNTQKAIPGSFRQIAENKIGFTIGSYDRSRELVIDPVLSYSTYLGGTQDEAHVHVAAGPDGNIYLAGSTMSTDFPLGTIGTPFQGSNAGAQDIFIAVLNPNALSAAQLIYATYLGGSGLDYPVGVAVSSNTDTGQGYDVYVAGTTTSTDFPTASVNAPFQAALPATAPAGNHGFVTRLNIAGNSLRYSTYLAGTNGFDTVTGLAIDTVGDAFVTGTTTSTNDVSNGFPADSNGFQTVSHAPNQFFATKINTKGTGSLSMLYSTYFGGGNPQSGTAQGGGIAVDASGNMYITGGTNFLGVPGGDPLVEVPFPLFNAQQSCLNEAGKTVNCANPPPTALDAFAAKINPNIAASVPVFSTYLGGSGNDIGYGIAVDSTSTYVTGSTTSTDWIPPTAIAPFQSAYGGGSTDAFIAKIGNPSSGTSFPLTYFTYLGGSGSDAGQAIVIDAVQAAHVAGTSNSPDPGFPLNPLSGQSCGRNGANDALVALISTTLSGPAPINSGDYVTCLGGSGDDQGMGIALDSTNAAYVSGVTISTDFPTTTGAFQSGRNGSHYDAFVSKLGPSSTLLLSPHSTSPTPNPVNAGSQVAFSFDLLNQGPDTATNVIFIATIPSTGVGSQAAKVTGGTGSSCTPFTGGTTITCSIPSLAAAATAVVEVDLTPASPIVNPSITVTGIASANGGDFVSTNPPQPSVSITDFRISATAPATITAGQTTSSVVTLTPLPTYTASISVSDSGLPTGATATFSPVSPISMSGTSQATTTLSIATTARPVTTGSLGRKHLFYATWLPVGGLSLLGLGVGAGYKRRRWLAGALLGLIASLILLQGACGSSSTPTTTGGTPAGTYTVTISGSNGTVTHTTTVLLIVN